MKLNNTLKILTVLLPLGGLLFGGWKYIQTTRLEAQRPFLEYQLELYKETARVAVGIATSGPQRQSELKRRFEELYWGELALVESRSVEAAMVQFRKALKLDSADLKPKALDLAHALRQSLAQSWQNAAWKRQ